MNTLRNEAPEPNEIEALLPWHAAGTLSPRDTARVEEALARDPELARRYALVREELGETIRLNETLGAPSARAMEKLMAAIDAEGASSRAPAAFNLKARIAEFIAGFSPRTLAYAAAAATVVVVLQAGLLANVFIQERSGQNYETASYRRSADSLAPTAAPSGRSADSLARSADSYGLGAAQPGSFAIVRFAPQASAAEITKFLEDNQLSVVEGPKAGGLYRIRVAAAPLPKEELARIVDRLQQNKLIGFVAPAE